MYKIIVNSKVRRYFTAAFTVLCSTGSAYVHATYQLTLGARALSYVCAGARLQYNGH